LEQRLDAARFFWFRARRWSIWTLWRKCSPFRADRGRCCSRTASAWRWAAGDIGTCWRRSAVWRC